MREKIVKIAAQFFSSEYSLSVEDVNAVEREG